MIQKYRKHMMIRLFLIAFTALLCFSIVTPVMGQANRPSMKWRKMEGGRPHWTVIGQNTSGQFLVLTQEKLRQFGSMRIDVMDTLGKVRKEVPLTFISPEGDDLKSSIDNVTFTQLANKTLAIASVTAGKRNVLYCWTFNLETLALEQPILLGDFEGNHSGSPYRSSTDDFSEERLMVRTSQSGEHILIAVQKRSRSTALDKVIGDGSSYFVFDQQMRLQFKGEFEGMNNTGIMVDFAINDDGMVVAQMQCILGSKKLMKESGKPYSHPMYLVSAKPGGAPKRVLLELANERMMSKARFIPQSDGGYLMVGAAKNSENLDVGLQTIRIDQDGGFSPVEYIELTKDFRSKEDKKTVNLIHNLAVKKVIPVGEGGYYLIGESSSTWLGAITGVFVLKTNQKGHIEWSKLIEKLSTGGFAFRSTDHNHPVVVNNPDAFKVPHFLPLVEGNKLHLFYESYDEYGKNYYSCTSTFEPTGYVGSKKTRTKNIESEYFMQDGYFDKSRNEWFLVRTRYHLKWDRYIGRFRLVTDAEIQGEGAGDKED
jgi:hypothetical protein